MGYKFLPRVYLFEKDVEYLRLSHYIRRKNGGKSR